MDALLDTGCLAGDFVARRIEDRFNIRPIINSAAELSVCSGLDKICYDISKSVIILNLSTTFLATKSSARHPVSGKASKLMLPFASSWETKVSTTGSRLGEVAI